MSKRAPKGRVKNPCRICNQTVAPKSGVQCKGACARWAHFKCLGYPPQKILDIRDGVIKITCPCPNCNPKVPVEQVIKSEKTLSEFFPDKLGVVPFPPDVPSPRKQPPRESPRQSPTRRPSPSDRKNLPPCPPPMKTSPCPKPSLPESQCIPQSKGVEPCPIERPDEPAKWTRSARELPPRKQYLYQPFIRKQTPCQSLHGKPPCLEPGEQEAPCHPTEVASMFERVSPKRSLIKPKDDFAFNPTSFEPQLFQPSSFNPELTSKGDTCDPHCIPPLNVPPPCDTPKCRAPLPKCNPPPAPSSPKEEPDRKNYKDCKTPPLTRTPSDISLVSPKVSPKQSKSPSPSSSPQKSSPYSSPSKSSSTSPKASSSTSPQKSPSGSQSKVPGSQSPKKAMQCTTSSSISSSSTPPCKKTASCQAPPPYTSLSCCKKCKNCKCSSNPSLLKSNCDSPICPKNVLAKPIPKAPPPSLKTALGVATSPIFTQQSALTPPSKPCSKKKPCINCTSSICPNQKPRWKSIETSTEKGQKISKSCTCLIVDTDPRMRPAVSDTKITNSYQTLLFTAIENLCTTVGQLSGQVKMLMSKMRVNGRTKRLEEIEERK